MGENPWNGHGFKESLFYGRIVRFQEEPRFLLKPQSPNDLFMGLSYGEGYRESRGMWIGFEWFLWRVLVKFKKGFSLINSYVSCHLLIKKFGLRSTRPSSLILGITLLDMFHESLSMDHKSSFAANTTLLLNLPGCLSVGRQPEYRFIFPFWKELHFPRQTASWPHQQQHLWIPFPSMMGKLKVHLDATPGPVVWKGSKLFTMV